MAYVIIDCPNCGICEKVYSQFGENVLSDICSADIEVLKDVKKQQPFVCKKCFTKYKIKTRMILDGFTVSI